MDTEQPERPLIQIDDLVRPMTEEEYDDYVANVTSRPGAPEQETPEE